MQLPTIENRTTILGSTGSGKTTFAVWLLSTRDFHIRPWVIFDFKGDKLINKLGAQEINIYENPPEEAGLYIVRPLPDIDKEAVTLFLQKCWALEEIGLYFDEGYMIGQRNAWFRALLTQGRSKHIEMIILSQRPKWMDVFTFSESNYFAVFNLTLKDDRDHIAAYLGGRKIYKINGRKTDLLPKYYCLWYDVDRQQSTVLAPVPQPDKLVEIFQRRLGQLKTEVEEV